MTDRPLIFHSNNPKDRTVLEKLKKSSGVRIVDEIEEQKKEFELVKNPSFLVQPSDLRSKNLKPVSATVWIYYPWRNTLVHSLNEKDFKYLRTSRNQNLITKDEQKIFDRVKVGIAGLNVGNPGAVCLALEGDIKMKLTDNDILSLSNLNRFRAGLPDLGLNKAVLTARQIWEINPFAKLEIFDKGISNENINNFLLNPRIDVLVEETDNLPLKIRIRELARENGIPVVMVTGSGPDVIIDIERFDLNKRLPLMSGYLKKEVIDSIKAGPGSFEEKIKLARDFMGVKYLHPRLTSSFRLVGKELAGIPQIAESSFLRGGAISYFVRQIVTGGKIKSGRYNLKLSDVK